MVTTDASLCIISLVVLTVVGEGQMASMQGISMDREPEDLMDREIRAPFNGMRGKRDYVDYDDLYSQFARKRAPFNGMRGKRAPFNGMRGKRGEEDDQLEQVKRAPMASQDIVGRWNRYLNLVKRRQNRAGFVGMRGK